MLLSEIFCLNELGGRQQNEDAVWPIKNAATRDDRLFIVCDGVGGSSCGEIASSLTCESLADYYKQNLKRGQKPDEYFTRDACIYALGHFKSYVQSHPDARDMST